ncbi:protein phosphatase 1 regulatory subunit 3D [Pristis pectinata]|uniref:protein phosphatase 1 regulatory subunit 3D n=1 Tax=Pristis pectinata TaxID=685728 RepID=UPI00223E28E3|nr:protein phosphatase 1 regulatory subunit 3D [Pristis pectinata]
MEKPAVHSNLCIPRNFSCMARLNGSLAEEYTGCGGDGGLDCHPWCQQQERSREGPGSCSSHPSPGQRRRAKSLPAPAERGAASLEKASACRANTKTVRFADSLGLELTTIRHFCDADMPQIPHRVMARLRKERPERLLSANMMDVLLDDPAHTLQPMFSNPASCPGFLERVRRDKVCLESISTDQFSLLGLIRVSNVAYEKQVVVRYTLNQWTSYVDIGASHSAHSADGQTDTFCFKLVTPLFLDTGGTLQFAIRYSVAGQEFWDNNKGLDYQVVSHKVKVSPPKDWENGWIHFI